MTKPHRLLLGTLALFALVCGMQTAWAGSGTKYSKQLERKMPVAANGTVTVENLAGAVNISQGGSQLQVSATVFAGGDNQAAARALADTIHLDVTRNAGHVLVHVHYPVDAHDSYQYLPTHPSGAHESGLHFFGLHFGGYSSSSFDYQGKRVRVYRGKDRGVPLHVDLEIRLPADIHASVVNKVGRVQASQIHDDLALETASGDIIAHGVTGKLQTRSGSGDVHVADLNGTLRIHTGSGDIKLHRIRGHAEAETGSGDIDGGNIRGDGVKLASGSGDIKLADLEGNLNVHSGSGDIELRGLSTVTEARVGSGSGDVHLGGDLSGMHDFDLSSGSGDITVSSSRPPAVHLDIHGSDIEVHWPGLRNVESGRRYFRADVGNASGNGKISTGSGDVVLH